MHIKILYSIHATYGSVFIVLQDLDFFLTAQQCTTAPTSAATMNEMVQETTTEMAILVEHEDVAGSISVLPVEQQ